MNIDVINDIVYITMGMGEPGRAATVTVDSVETLEPDAEATVENVGTRTDARLKFGIPRGDPAPVPIWGGISGNLEDQTDLSRELAKKIDIYALGALAVEDSIDYFSEQLTNKPELGAMAAAADAPADGSVCLRKNGEWKDADPPYELIETITLTADTAEVVRTLTPSGESYAFQKLLIHAVVPPGSSATEYYLYVRPDSNSRVIYLRNTSTSANMLALVSLEVRNGRLFASGADAARYWNSSYAYLTPQSYGYMQMDAITYIALRNSSYDLPAGTVIEIYGVWR